MIKLFEEQKETIYKVQKDLKLDKNRLYRYASGKFDIDSMPVTLVLQLAYYFKIEPNELIRKMKQYRSK